MLNHARQPSRTTAPTPAMNRALTRILLLTLLGVSLLLLTICGVEEDSTETVHGRVTDVQARSITEVGDLLFAGRGRGDVELRSRGASGVHPVPFAGAHAHGRGVSVRFRRAGDILIAVSVADYP